MMFCGVPAGASVPYQVCTSNHGMPDSAAVGTSGIAAARFGPSTASARSVPACTCGLEFATPTRVATLFRRDDRQQHVGLAIRSHMQRHVAAEHFGGPAARGVVTEGGDG